MDALLAALIGCLWGEVGDKSQLLMLALAHRFARKGALIAGIAVAATATAVTAAIAGAFLAPMLGSSARLLFLAIAVLFLGIGMFWRIKAPDPLSTWPTGPFLTAALGLFILGFGDGSQFLILGIATRTAHPALAALGGALGIMAALVPVVLLRESVDKLPLRAIRIAGGAVMLLIGLVAAVKALGLA